MDTPLIPGVDQTDLDRCTPRDREAIFTAVWLTMAADRWLRSREKYFLKDLAARLALPGEVVQRIERDGRRGALHAGVPDSPHACTIMVHCVAAMAQADRSLDRAEYAVFERLLAGMRASRTSPDPQPPKPGDHSTSSDPSPDSAPDLTSSLRSLGARRRGGWRGWVSPPADPSEAGFLATGLWNLAAIALFGWNASQLLILYWCENVVIGLFNVPRIILAGTVPSTPWARFNAIGGKVGLALFFLIHYGGFTLVHGVFVGVFADMLRHRTPDSQFPIVALFHTLFDGSALIAATGLALLIVPHAMSFWKDFLRGGEHARISPDDQMLFPYSRIITLHLILIAGFVPCLFLPRAFAAALVIGKAFLDPWAHRRERRRYAKMTGNATDA